MKTPNIDRYIVVNFCNTVPAGAKSFKKITQILVSISFLSNKTKKNKVRKPLKHDIQVVLEIPIKTQTWHHLVFVEKLYMYAGKKIKYRKNPRVKNLVFKNL